MPSNYANWRFVLIRSDLVLELTIPWTFGLVVSYLVLQACNSFYISLLFW